jgi:multiple sugar transport system permease protein
MKAKSLDGDAFFRIVAWGILTIGLVAVALPFLWIFSTSLRLPRESFSLPPQILPRPPFRWRNYAQVFETFPFALFVFNSALISSLAVAGQMLTSTMGAYAFARLHFRGRDALFVLVLAGLMVPSQVTIIPLFILMSKFGLVDTRAALLLPSLVFPMAVFLIRQFMLSLPRDYDEAAFIDGAGHFAVYARILVPMVKSPIIVSSMIHLLAVWNDFFRPLIFINTFEKMTLPLGLYALNGFMGAGSLSVILAGVVLSIIPPLVFYAFGQRYLMLGLRTGGIKA